MHRSFLQELSKETVSDITLVDDESGKGMDSVDQASGSRESSTIPENNEPDLVSVEEIASPSPPLASKTDLIFNGKRHPVKLLPDIGYFVKALPRILKPSQILMKLVIENGNEDMLFFGF